VEGGRQGKQEYRIHTKREGAAYATASEACAETGFDGARLQSVQVIRSALRCAAADARSLEETPGTTAREGLTGPGTARNEA